MIMKLNFVILLSLLTTMLSAQGNFMSLQLNKLYNLLPENCKKEIGILGTCHCISGGNDIQVNSTAIGGVIDHLGLKLFDNNESDFYQKAVTQFVERYFLEMIITDNISEFYKRRKEQNITLLYNGRSIEKFFLGYQKNVLSVLKNPTSKRIEKDSLNYAVSISEGMNHVRLSFPANNCLVKGMDKKELDNELEKDLRNYRSVIDTTVLVNQSQNFIPSKGYNTLKGSAYYKSITSDTYYTMQDKGYGLIYDKRFLAESLVNVLLDGTILPEKKITISHHQYADEISSYSLFLKDYIGFFKNRNYKLYIGIENNSVDKLQATMVIYNTYLNFVNIVYIDTTEDSLFNPENTISLKLYSNIPCDNIKDLFGTYFESEPKN